MRIVSMLVAASLLLVHISGAAASPPPGSPPPGSPPPGNPPPGNPPPGNPPPGNPPQNMITVSDALGAGETNYPFQFGRPFLRGAIPHAPGVLINGVAVLSQADVKNRYPDGSVEFAVISVIVQQIPANGSVSLTFDDDLANDNTPLTQAQMKALLPIGSATLTLTPTSGLVGIADAGQMLADGNCKPWTSGPVAQTVECADDTAARKYDIGLGDGFHPFRPRFFVTFWPMTKQVFVRAVGENGLTTEQEDLRYKLTISSNGTTLYTKDLTGAVPIGSPTKYPLIHWSNSRWSKTFWFGSMPSAQVNIDENLPYLESTRFLPNLDPSIAISESTIAANYTSYLAAPHDIYDGEWDGAWPYPWINAMGTAGDSGHIGPFPLVTSLWLHSADWRMRYMALNQADIAAAWPLNWRESDPARIFQRGDAAGSGTGLGRPMSVAGRPTLGNNTGDNVIKVGTVALPSTVPWTADDAHQPSIYFPAYVLTGDPWYLEMLDAWAGTTAFIDAPSPAYNCQKQTTNCSIFRGPTGAYGGLFGSDAARDVAWTLRGRAETAFAAPDGTPEKSYFTYMTNDAIAKWEGSLGITGTAFDAATDKVWVKGTDYPYVWTFNVSSPDSGKIPPLGNMAALCTPVGATPLCGYSAATQTAWGLLAGADGSFDSPWMNFYLEYAVGRAVELGFAMQKIEAIVDQFPIGIIESSIPQFLAAYQQGVAKVGGGFWPTWSAYYAGGADPIYLAGLGSGFAGGLAGGRQLWVTPGLAMAVDDAVPGAATAWEWFDTNGYSLPNVVLWVNKDPRWAIVPRTDNNVLPPQPTATPP